MIYKITFEEKFMCHRGPRGLPFQYSSTNENVNIIFPPTPVLVDPYYLFDLAFNAKTKVYNSRASISNTSALKKKKKKQIKILK